MRLLFLHTHRETDRFFTTSGVHLPEQNRGLFHFRGGAFTTNLKEKVDSSLTKTTVLRFLVIHHTDIHI